MVSYTLIVIIVLVAMIIVLALLMANFLIQVKSLRKQVRFIAHNKTNQRIGIRTSSKQIKALSEDLNYFIESTSEKEIETMRKDNELKDTIVNMSHDIRTPLTSLSGYFDLLLMSDTQEERDKYSVIIKERINSLSELLESMFFYTKLSSDSIKPSFEKCDVSSLLMQTLFSYYDDIEKKGLEPEIDVDEGVELVTDEKLLRRIIQNLIKNVLAHGQDKMKVSLKCDERQVILSLSNKYDASKPIDANRVFDRFYQSDATRNNNSSGIGLSAVEKLVRLLNGKAAAEVEGEEFKIIISLRK